MVNPTNAFLPITTIFVLLAVLIISGSLIMSNYAIFNPMSATEGLYQPEIVYTHFDTHETLTNTCKFPYPFLMNGDVKDGREHISENCIPNELTYAIQMSPQGVLTLHGKPEINELLDSITCSYYKHSGISNQSVKVERDKPQNVSFFDFAVACKREGIVEFLKPMVNFAVIPKEIEGESVAVLFLPSMNHKMFMKFMPKSRTFMKKDKAFLFSQMATKQEPRPFRDILLQLGISSEMSLFQKAKLHNFTTFFSGPQQIRELIDADHDTSDHRSFIFQYLIDDKKCLEDGRRFVDDQLERFHSFLTATKGFKFFSTFFIDDYGMRKKAIDFDLSKSLEYLESNGVFKNTTLFITSYDLYNNETVAEDDKNPFLAVRVSDNLKSLYTQQNQFLKMNFNRLITSSQIYATILNFLEPSSKVRLSTWSGAASIFRVCSNSGIPASMCLCMNMSTKSEYPPSLEAKFLAEIHQKFENEVIHIKCVKKMVIKSVPAFYTYKSKIKGEVRVVELSADVTSMGPFGKRVLPVKKTFTFEPMFESYRSYDTARIQINHGINVDLIRLCFL